MSYIVGLMSGTSLDGCDAALVEVGNGTPRLVAFSELPMPEGLHQKILDGCSLAHSDVRMLCSLNVELGAYFADAALAVCQKADMDPKTLLCIGSHGQTMYHIPQDEMGFLASTLQLGEPAVIAARTGAAVVSSFRAMDMAWGGQGAPLVPYAEYLLYRGSTSRCLHNLGGIGNVTAMPADCALGDVFAFDTGPANMIINALMQHFTGKPYDDCGRVAARGSVHEALLSEWMQMPFVLAPPPKSTGRELYGAQFVEAALTAHPEISPQDFVHTATLYTAETMRVNYETYVFPRCDAREIILSGGGSHNIALRQMIQNAFPGRTVLTQEDLSWSSDAKEAVAFALLAYETMCARPANVPGATGASRPCILGNITPKPY